MRWLPRLVTLAVVVLLVGGAVLFIWRRIPKVTVGQNFTTYAMFRDGSHLAVGSPVVIAGVRVGEIINMHLDGRFARVDMRLQDNLDLPSESFATRRADSLFGDSYVEIIPSTGEGADSMPRLKSGDPIPHVIEGSSTDALLRGIENGLPKIDNAMQVLHDAVVNSRKWVGGPLDDKLDNANEWLGEGHIEDPLASADHALARIDDLTARGADALANTAPQVEKTLDRIDKAVATTRVKLADAKTGLVQALHDTREGLNNVDPQLDQAADLMAAIDQGKGDDWKGQLGRLVNDPHLADEIEDITASAAEGTSSFNRFKTWLGMRAEVDTFSQQVRFYATAEIRARHDKFYLIEIERGPLGGVPNDELSDVVNSPDYLRTQSIHDRARFTAQFGKQFGPLSVRGGLKDSTFGIGADMLFLDGRLKVSTDVFGSFQRTPRVKVSGALEVFRSVYVLGGIDDALNKPGYLQIESGGTPVPQQFKSVRYGRDYFLGTMLIFNDADISTLLRVYGALLVGLL